VSGISDALLSAVVNYGAPAFGVCLFFGALGIPIPTTLLVVAAGAFVRQGAFNIAIGFALGLAGAVLGDSLCYGIGRFASVWTERRFGASKSWQNARRSFQRYGGLSVYLTRWLVPSLAIPVNLIAGSTRFAYIKFLAGSLSGETTWLVVFGGLGYLFGSQWEAISQVISDFGGLALGILVLALGVYLALHVFRFRSTPASPLSAKPASEPLTPPVSPEA
jgi:membrane-associated protein